MGGAGDGVLVDAVIGSEDAAGDILLVAGRGDHHQPIDLAKLREIGPHGAHRSLVRQQRDGRSVAAPAEECRHVADAQRFAQAGQLAFLDRVGGKVELQ